jgi:hypothetical protein
LGCRTEKKIFGINLKERQKEEGNETVAIRYGLKFEYNTCDI